MEKGLHHPGLSDAQMEGRKEKVAQVPLEMDRKIADLKQKIERLPLGECPSSVITCENTSLSSPTSPIPCLSVRNKFHALMECLDVFV